MALQLCIEGGCGSAARMFVHLLRTPDARYAIGAMVSWPVYGTLYITMPEIFDRHYSAAAGVSWILSYGVVYAFQKYGTFGAMGREAMLREIGRYAFAVVGLSAAVNFGLVTVLADFDPTLNKIAAVPLLYDRKFSPVWR